MERRIKMQVTAICRHHRHRYDKTSSGIVESTYESVDVRLMPVWEDGAALKPIVPLELEMLPENAAVFQLGNIYELRFLEADDWLSSPRGRGA